MKLAQKPTPRVNIRPFPVIARLRLHREGVGKSHFQGYEGGEVYYGRKGLRGSGGTGSLVLANNG